MKNFQVVPALSTFFNDEALMKNSLSINKNARKNTNPNKNLRFKVKT